MASVGPARRRETGVSSQRTTVQQTERPTVALVPKVPMNEPLLMRAGAGWCGMVRDGAPGTLHSALCTRPAKMGLAQLWLSQEVHSRSRTLARGFPLGRRQLLGQATSSGVQPVASSTGVYVRGWPVVRSRPSCVPVSCPMLPMLPTCCPLLVLPAPCAANGTIEDGPFQTSIRSSQSSKSPTGLDYGYL